MAGRRGRQGSETPGALPGELGKGRREILEVLCSSPFSAAGSHPPSLSRCADTPSLSIMPSDALSLFDLAWAGPPTTLASPREGSVCLRFLPWVSGAQPGPFKGLFGSLPEGSQMRV